LAALAIKCSCLRKKQRPASFWVKGFDKARGFTVKSRRVPIIQARMSHSGLRCFCLGRTALVKLDFLQNFAGVLRKPLQSAAFGPRNLRKQILGFVEAPGITRGFCLIVQRGKARRKSIDIFARSFPMARDHGQG
jgi:hypothetical protein